MESAVTDAERGETRPERGARGGQGGKGREPSQTRKGVRKGEAQRGVLYMEALRQRGRDREGSGGERWGMGSRADGGDVQSRTVCVQASWSTDAQGAGRIQGQIEPRGESGQPVPARESSPATLDPQS